MDTNFLITAIKFKIPFLQELKGDELFIVDKTKYELEKLIKGGNASDKQLAKIALELISKNKIKIIRSEKEDSVDKTLEKLHGYIIATQDKELKDKLKGKIIVIRAKKKLELR